MTSRKKTAGTFSTGLLNAPYIVWSTVFIVVPLIFVVYYSFFDARTGKFSTEFIKLFFTNSIYLKSFGTAVLLSVASTLISLLIAYPFSYFLSKKSPKSQAIQMILIMLPMWMSMLVRTYSWANILEYNGIINKLFEWIGLSKVKMLGSYSAVILGMVYNYIPYMILPIYTNMSKIGKPLLEAAEDLGCNGFNKLRRVIFPLSFSGVVAGVIMVFVPSVSTFYISQKMSNGQIVLIGDIIEMQFKEQGATGGFNRGAAMSLILMVIILICTFIMNKFSDDDMEGGMIV